MVHKENQQSLDRTKLDSNTVLYNTHFNYSDIDWSIWTTKSENPDSQKLKCIECIRDSFLYQHITKPTRVRGTDTPNVLDLIFTNEANMVNNMRLRTKQQANMKTLSLRVQHRGFVLNRKQHRRK